MAARTPERSVVAPPGFGLGRIRLLGLLASPLLFGAAPQPSNSLLNLDSQREARAVDRDADRAGAQAASAAIASLRSRLISLGREESEGQRHAGGARARLGQLDLREAELKDRMGHNQQSLTQLLGALQMYARDPPPPLLVDPRSARDAVRATILIKAITPELEARARAFAAQSEALKSLRRQADAQNGVLFEAESAVADRQARIEDLIARKQALEKQLNTDAAVAQTDVQRLAARARSMGELVRTLNAHDAGEGEAASLPARFTPPVQGALAHGFGDTAGDREHAKGVTWSTAPNATVLAPAAAAVDYAGPLKGWGLVLILRTGDFNMVLAGLGEIGTEAGRTVAGGEPIGKMPGDTAHPALYLEVRQANRPVDPIRWLPELASGTAQPA